MTFINDLAAGGIDPIQHHTKSRNGVPWDRDFRILRFAGRVESDVDGVSGLIGVEENTLGPIMGGWLWQTLNNSEWPRFWAHGPVATVQKQKRPRPLTAGNWDTSDAKEESLNPATPHDQKFPDGWTSFLCNSINYTEQHYLSAPNFDGIVTQHFNKFEMGSPWWDARDGILSERYKSRTQSLARVVLPFVGCGTGNSTGPILALQLYGSGDGDDSMRVGNREFLAGGYMADLPVGTAVSVAPGNQHIATMSWRRGGPFHVGVGRDKHKRGKNDDGEILNPLHLWVGAKWTDAQGGRDGPIEFQQQIYVPPTRYPFLAEAYLRYDPEMPHSDSCGDYKGVWRFETTSNIIIIKSEPKDPPPIPEPPKTPPLVPVPLPDPKIPPLDPFPEGIDQPPLSYRFESNIFPKVSTITDQKNELRELSGTSLEIAAPSQAWQAPLWCSTARDTRNDRRIDSDYIAYNEFIRRPVVLRQDSYGYQRDDCDDWFRTTTGGNTRTRYAEVDTAPGGVVDMPPELGMESVTEWENGLVSTSTTYRVFWDVRTAWGTPDTSTGGIKNGFIQQYSQDAFGFSSLNVSHSNASGTVTEVHRIQSSGDIRLGASGSSVLISRAGISGNVQASIAKGGTFAMTSDINTAIASFSGLFGDGSDGAATIASGTTTLTRDMYYTTLTVTGELDANGYRIYADTISIEEGGVISNNGGDASGLTAGAGASAGTVGGGTDGKAGDTGTGLNGNDATNAIGGSGGEADSQAGGQVTNPAAMPRAFPPITQTPTGTLYQGGAGGATGDGDGANEAGGSGGGGGVLYIAARRVSTESSTPVFEAKGGAGAAGTGGNASGSAGGGGGALILIYQQLSIPSALASITDVSGGAGGAGSGSGSNGVVGSEGAIYAIQMGDPI